MCLGLLPLNVHSVCRRDNSNTWIEVIMQIFAVVFVQSFFERTHPPLEWLKLQYSYCIHLSGVIMITVCVCFFNDCNLLVIFVSLQLYIMFNFGLYTSPIVAAFLYRKGYFVYDGIVTVARFLTGVGIILAASYCLRGIGRATNPTYVMFLEALEAAKKDLNKDTKVSYNFN